MTTIDCRGKQAWPELVGKKGEAAAKKIEAENRGVKAIVLLDGTIVTHDYRCDRVWVWVDRHGFVVSVPKGDDRRSDAWLLISVVQ